MFGWGILMPIGVMVARYLRQYDPIWFYSHTTIQSLGFILGFAGVISGLVLNSRLQNNVNRHKGLGIFILLLGCLQVCLKLFLKWLDLHRWFWLLIFILAVFLYWIGYCNIGETRQGIKNKKILELVPLHYRESIDTFGNNKCFLWYPFRECRKFLEGWFFYCSGYFIHHCFNAWDQDVEKKIEIFFVMFHSCNIIVYFSCFWRFSFVFSLNTLHKTNSQFF